MAKIKLVIADTDANYSKALSDYLCTNFSNELQVSYFTKGQYLCQYLENNGDNPDVLLLNPAFYDEAINIAPNIAIILLSDGMLEKTHDHCAVINKYQSGDKLGNMIVQTIISQHPERMHIQNGGKDTKLIAVYSPAGGAGKTAITVAGAVISALAGFKVLYLSYEDIQSTSLFFDCNNTRTMSYVFYYLKEKTSDLSLRLEAAKNIDMASGVHYFAPLESPLEMEEIQIEDILYLMEEIRTQNQYNYVFVDMPNHVDNKTIKILEVCHLVLLVDGDQISGGKTELFLKYIMDRQRKAPAAAFPQIIKVSNKCRADAANTRDDHESNHLFCIPFDSTHLANVDGRLAINVNSPFGAAVRTILESYVFNGGAL